jgi:hypothetical protein
MSGHAGEVTAGDRRSPLVSSVGHVLETHRQRVVLEALAGW